MRAAAFVFTVALAAGCSNTTVSVGVGNPPPPVTGTVATSGASGLNVVTTSGAVALGMAFVLSAADYANNPTGFPSPSVLLQPTTPAPELATSRLISEQDCS